MRSFAEAWPDETILHTVLAKLTWNHNIATLYARWEELEAKKAAGG